MVQALKDRPAYVTFEIRSVEDRTESIAQGHYVGKDVVFALITPMGSKDQIERVAEEWFQKLKRDVAENRLPRDWYELYKGAYNDFLENRETPLNGTSVKNWPAISPSQVKTLLSVGVRTVEDLAAANEEIIARVGMGARELKQRAVEWLTTAGDVGKVAEHINALKVENEALSLKNKELTETVQALVNRLDILEGTTQQKKPSTAKSL